MRDGEIPSNPCQIVGAGSTRTAERPVPTLTQVHQLADLVPARYEALVLVAAYGGLRFGELTALPAPTWFSGKTSCPCCASESR